MSDLGTESPQPNHQDAKAQAKAAKAYAKAARPWFKKKRFIIPLAGVVIFALAQTASGDDSGETTTTAGGNASNGSKSETEEASAAGLNDPVRDGKFEFTVKKVDCGKTHIGTELLGTKAQGQFCLVSVKVENIGDKAQSLFGDNQLLFDGQGREFSADTEAAIYMADKAQTLWEEINPGNHVNGVVVFDIPKDAKPASIELHDSAFSEGVTVTLK